MESTYRRSATIPMNTGRVNRLSSSSSASSLNSGQSKLPGQRTIEDKIAHVVESAKAVGFKDLDSMITTYYTGTFEVMSQAHEWQRKSRSRGLGSLLHAINSSARGWSEYERQGYQSETFKVAEQLYRVELQTVDKNKWLWRTPGDGPNAEKATLESQVSTLMFYSDCSGIYLTSPTE